jgi:hypothetical protein
MANSDAELMRKLLDHMHAVPTSSELDENMVTRALSKLGMKATNWLSKKFGNIGLDWRSLSQYQTPATLKMFQTWMRQYRQSYETVTWNTLNDFFVRNSQLRNIQFTDEISGRTLTKAELAEVFADDRQVLMKIVGPKYVGLLPRNASEFNTKVTAKELIGGGDADAAYAVIVAVVEAVLVHMFMLAQPEADDTASAASAASAPTGATAATTVSAPGAAAGTTTAAPGTTPTLATPTVSGSPVASAPTPSALTADQIDLLRKLLGITP